MNSVNLWVAEICLCAVTVTIAENILPSGNIKKTVYFVLSLIVMMSFISPIKDFSVTSLDLSLVSEEEILFENTDWFNRMTEESFQSNVSLLVEECLDKIEVKAKNIEVITDKTEDNSIVIDIVKITIEDKEKIDVVSNEIYTQLGLNCDVIIR